MADQEHWNRVYGAREEQALTWFEPAAELSFNLVATYCAPDQSVIDVGGGASRLVDGLLQRGQARVAVLDLSHAALAASKDRLGQAADAVEWIVADVTTWEPEAQWNLWHDRAVFHFLTESKDRAAYFRTMAKALAHGGVAVIATFAPDGPETCSQLPVQRWSANDLAAAAEGYAPGMLELVETRRHVHVTPKGNQQPFTVCVFRRIDKTG